MVRGFAREDLFTVVLEHFLTDTADHADYVLPATTQLEHLDVHTSYGHTYVLLNQPAIAPLGEARPNTADLPRAGRAHGLRRAVLRRRRRDAGARGLRRRGATSTTLREQRLGQAAAARRAVRRGRFPTRQRQVRMVDAPGLGVPDHVPNYESVQSRRSWRSAIRWR